MILKHPKATEKAVRLIDAENKIVFVVERGADKADIKEEVERLFSVKVDKVNTHIAPTGEKVAYVKLGKESEAIDLATKLGLM